MCCNSLATICPYCWESIEWILCDYPYHCEGNPSFWQLSLSCCWPYVQAMATSKPFCLGDRLGPINTNEIQTGETTAYSYISLRLRYSARKFSSEASKLVFNIFFFFCVAFFFPNLWFSHSDFFQLPSCLSHSFILSSLHPCPTPSYSQLSFPQPLLPSFPWCHFSLSTAHTSINTDLFPITLRELETKDINVKCTHAKKKKKKKIEWLTPPNVV